MQNLKELRKYHQRMVWMATLGTLVEASRLLVRDFRKLRKHHPGITRLVIANGTYTYEGVVSMTIRGALTTEREADLLETLAHNATVPGTNLIFATYPRLYDFFELVKFVVNDPQGLLCWGIIAGVCQEGIVVRSPEANRHVKQYVQQLEAESIPYVIA